MQQGTLEDFRLKEIAVEKLESATKLRHPFVLADFRTTQLYNQTSVLCLSAMLQPAHFMIWRSLLDTSRVRPLPSNHFVVSASL